jgi:Uma2 family endonuclease
MVFVPTKRKLTADEYERMGECGILHEDERVELIDGEIVEMPPIGDDHIGRVISLEYWFGQRLAGRAFVSTQNPIRLSDYSEPQPDMVLLRPREDFYGTSKARPEDIVLLVEVAQSSLEYDWLVKLPRYAAAGIVEVWLVNLIDRCIEVYRDPGADGYATQTVHRRGDTLAPAAFPDLIIRVEEILG